jgi:hypothetical protein
VLDPHDRRLLLEALRPPSGYTFDCAIGTTFSLDLIALLTAPLAFTLFEWPDDEERGQTDPLALLEAVRRHADSITIFCQAGQIAVPPRDKALLGYLEGSVVEVMPRRKQGVFHPKVWVLRFQAEKQVTRYRVLCLSRNLTFDRSWDTILVLDGEVARGRGPVETSVPLAELVKALPRLATRPVSAAVRANVDRVQRELRRVRFELPNGFDELRFWTPGIGGDSHWPFDGRVDRMLVVSPFVSDGCLSRLTRQGSGHVLVSRIESLLPLAGECLSHFDRVSVLSDAADAEATDDRPEETMAPSPEVPPTGLHAKLYVADSGWDARIWTDAAFANNVEILVELRGKKSHCGVDAVLAQSQGKTGLSDLLEPFSPPGAPVLTDLVRQRLDRLVTEARRGLAGAGLTARIDTADDIEFRLGLDWDTGRAPRLPGTVAVRCWPITLHESTAQSLVMGSDVPISFGRLSFEAITSFLAFEVIATVDQQHAATRFVLNLPLVGAPTDRRERILRSLLKDRGQVLRLLLLLLADDGVESRDVLLWSRGLTSASDTYGTEESGLPLFEPLVRALVDAPDKLDRVARLVADLRKTADGQRLLPDGFDEVWQPILTAREMLAR